MPKTVLDHYVYGKALADLDSTRKELEECKIQLRAADNGLLKASDPKSNWQGIRKECKLWQEKAESLEKELELLREKVRRYFKTVL